MKRTSRFSRLQFVALILPLLGLLFSAKALAAVESYEVVMESLMTSMKVWSELDQYQKAAAVKAYREFFKRLEKAQIRKPASFYVSRVDEMLEENPDFNHGLPALLKFYAILEYDFENGQDQDQLAKFVLGDFLYSLNKLRRAP